LIAYLAGTIRKKLTKAVIIDTGSIGYLVNLPAPLLEKTVEKAGAEFFIHTKVREDDISLYGFDTISGLEFFKTLLNVNGIGPKLAMEIMGQNPEKVKAALLSGDLLYLTKIPGIGKKTAERLVVELKGKIDWADIDISRTHAELEKTVSEDAINALMGLGYQRFEIIRILKDMPEKNAKIEDFITYFLQNV
jgi:holliday junction DNA helicase RuvA